MLKVGVNHGFSRLSVVYSIDSDFKAIKRLYESGSVWRIRVIVDPDWSAGEICDRVSVERMVENSVRVIRNIRRLEFIMVLSKDVVNLVFDLERIEAFCDFKVCLMSLVQSPTGYFPSCLYLFQRIKNLPDILKNVWPWVFFESAR